MNLIVEGAIKQIEEKGNLTGVNQCAWIIIRKALEAAQKTDTQHAKVDIDDSCCVGDCKKPFFAFVCSDHFNEIRG